MKLCKDCKYYSARHFIYDGDKLGWSPEWCSKKIGEPDPVNGEFVRAGDPKATRKDESKCGMQANWFEAGTLDGRLAALEDRVPVEEIQIEHSGD